MDKIQKLKFKNGAYEIEYIVNDTIEVIRNENKNKRSYSLPFLLIFKRYDKKEGIYRTKIKVFEITYFDKSKKFLINIIKNKDIEDAFSNSYEKSNLSNLVSLYELDLDKIKENYKSITINFNIINLLNDWTEISVSDRKCQNYFKMTFDIINKGNKYQILIDQDNSNIVSKNTLDYNNKLGVKVVENFSLGFFGGLVCIFAGCLAVEGTGYVIKRFKRKIKEIKERIIINKNN